MSRPPAWTSVVVWCWDGGQVRHAIYHGEDDEALAICGTMGRFRGFFDRPDLPKCKRCQRVAAENARNRR